MFYRFRADGDGNCSLAYVGTSAEGDPQVRVVKSPRLAMRLRGLACAMTRNICRDAVPLLTHGRETDYHLSVNTDGVYAETDLERSILRAPKYRRIEDEIRSILRELPSGGPEPEREGASRSESPGGRAE